MMLSFLERTENWLSIYHKNHQVRQWKKIEVCFNTEVSISDMHKMQLFLTKFNILHTNTSYPYKKLSKIFESFLYGYILAIVSVSEVLEFHHAPFHQEEIFFL